MSYRTERDRSEQERRIANLRHNHTDSSQKYLGTVFNGGAMATTLPAWFLTYPTQVAGSELEGSAGTFTTDIVNVIPVLVIGSTVPTVGDVLPARNIGGFWIAERGGVEPCQWNCATECVFSSAPRGGVTAQGIPIVSSDGKITGIRMTVSGSGYITAPTVTFHIPLSGGIQAKGTPTLKSGSVTGVVMTNEGSGYVNPLPMPSAFSFTMTGNGITYGPFLLTPRPGGLGDWPYASVPCVWETSGAVLNVAATDSCPAVSIPITIAVVWDVSFSPAQWVSIIEYFGNATSGIDVINCGEPVGAVAHVSCLSTVGGGGETDSTPLGPCLSRPYSFTYAIAGFLIINNPAQPSAVTYLAFGGACNGSPDPIDIIVTCTLTEA